MNEIDIRERERLILKKLFLLSNKLQTVGDRVLAGEMTIMQWLLTVAVVQSKDFAPTLGEIAQFMGSSRQNVKQIAMKLQKEGFLSIERDAQDTRIIRIKLKDKSFNFWQNWHEKITDFLIETFSDLRKDEITMLYDCLCKLYDNILRMDSALINDEGCY